MFNRQLLAIVLVFSLYLFVTEVKAARCEWAGEGCLNSPAGFDPTWDGFCWVCDDGASMPNQNHDITLTADEVTELNVYASITLRSLTLTGYVICFILSMLNCFFVLSSPSHTFLFLFLLEFLSLLAVVPCLL